LSSDSIPLPDVSGSHATSTVWLGGKLKATYRYAGDGFLVVGLESQHGYTAVCATEEQHDMIYAGLKAFAKARKAAQS
jgi:hypothetical protein